MLTNFLRRFERKSPEDIESGSAALSHRMIHSKCIVETATPHPNPAFLPLYRHLRFLDDDRIRTTMRKKKIRKRDLDQLVNYVKTDAGRTFLTLVYVDEVENILNLHREGFTDDNLPIDFEESGEAFSSKNQLLDSQKYFPGWSTLQKEMFEERQWVFLAESISESTFWYKLYPKQPLPFNPLSDSNIGNGKLAAVYKIGVPNPNFNNVKVRNTTRTELDLC